MNGVATFRLCKLSNDDLIKKVDSGTDEMFKTGKIPTRNIPARPDEDYDLLVGEMIYRFGEQSARIRELEEALDRIVTAYNETGEVASAIRGCEQALRKTKKEQS